MNDSSGRIELTIHRPGKDPLTVSNPVPLLLQHHFGPMSIAGAMTCCIEDLTARLAHLLTLEKDERATFYRFEEGQG